MTPDSYSALEADGFAAQAYGLELDEAQLRADLERYTPQMGRENRRLALQNHHALDHATELVNLIRRHSPSTRPAPVAPLREMARLVRLQGQTDWRCGVLTGENSGLWAENAALRKDLEEERERAQKGLAAAREQVEEERARAREETAAAWGQLEAFRRTRRYRLATLLGRPLDALRRFPSRP